MCRRRGRVYAPHGVVRIASEQEQRADEVSADDRADQVGDLLARPNEIALEVGKADLAFVSVLDQSDDFALVRNDLHGGKIIRAQQTGRIASPIRPMRLLQSISITMVFAASDLAAYCDLHQ